MKRLAVYLLLLVIALPALAQTPEPTPTPTPTPEQAPPPPPQQKQKSWFVSHLFFGGGVGASFGDVDYVEVAPMVGLQIIPRFGVGVQPFYQWTEYGIYSPSVETSDYGARVFARFRVWGGLFAEADYEYTNYEYPIAPGTTSTTRGSYDAFLVGGGYHFGIGGKVGMYASALYDLNYDDDDPFRPYDSAIRYSVGVSVGF